MTRLVREPDVEIAGHRFFVVSEQFVTSHRHAHKGHQHLCVCGSKTPLAVLKRDGDQDIILALDEEKLDCDQLKAFLGGK